MLKYSLFNYEVEIDKNATTAWYTSSNVWGCECGDCRNFIALAQKRAFPLPVLQILDMLNIPPEKATYVCELYPVDGGHCYQFSYRIVGNILLRCASPIVQNWGMGLCCHEPYPYGAPGFPEPHFDLEFSLNLPWVLEDALNK